MARAASKNESMKQCPALLIVIYTLLGPEQPAPVQELAREAQQQRHLGDWFCGFAPAPATLPAAPRPADRPSRRWRARDWPHPDSPTPATRGVPLAVVTDPPPLPRRPWLIGG